MQWFCEQRGVNLRLFLVLCQRASFVSNEVDIGVNEFEDIGLKLGLKPYSVRRGVQALVRSGCLKKKGTKCYIINPRLCFRGSPARAQALWYQYGFKPMK